MKITDIEKTYLMLQASSGLKIRDKVKVTRSAKDHEKGWMNTWEFQMHDYIGKTFKIFDIGTYGIVFEEQEYGYRFPYFVLEKVED